VIKRYTWNVACGTFAGRIWSLTIHDSTERKACKNVPVKKFRSYTPSTYICTGRSMASIKLAKGGIYVLLAEYLAR
jgi:hypothetical protein